MTQQLEMAFEEPTEASLRWQHLDGWVPQWQAAPCPDCGQRDICVQCAEQIREVADA